MTLTDFLLARIAEDEAAAWAAPGGADTSGQEALGDYLIAFPPARVLAECEAKRRIVGRHTDCDDTSFGEPCDDLRDLAAVYADHPDYRDEWRA